MAPYGGIAGSDGRYQKKEMIEKYLDKSSYLPRDHLTNQAISAANAAQAAAAAVAAAAAAANVTSSSNLTYGTSTFPPSSAPLLNNALASTTAYGMSGLPATNAMLEDLIEGKHNLIITIYSVHSSIICYQVETGKFPGLPDTRGWFLKVRGGRPPSTSSQRLPKTSPGFHEDASQC